jgi:uncharacterized protein YjiK
MGRLHFLCFFAACGCSNGSGGSDHGAQAGSSSGGAAGASTGEGSGGAETRTGGAAGAASVERGGTSGGPASAGSSAGKAEPSTGGALAGGGGSAADAGSATGGNSATGGTPAGGASIGGTPTGGRSSTGGASPAAGENGAATPLDRFVRAQGPVTLNGLDNASGIAWKPETNTFFIVSNGSHSLYEYSGDFKSMLRTVSLDNGGTDTEDVVYLGANRFAVVDEENEVYVVTVSDGASSASMSSADVEHYVVSAPPATINRGFEGIAFRPDVGAAGEFIVCQEGGVTGTPMRVLFFDRRTNAGTSSYVDATLAVREPWDALGQLGARATDLAAVAFEQPSATLLVLSQESSRLFRVAPQTGAILEQRDLSGSPQYEGLTLASEGRLVLVSEPNFVEVYRPN